MAIYRSNEDYSPVVPRHDADGTVWMMVKWVDNAAAAKTGMLLIKGATGWESLDPFDGAASQVDGRCLVGFSDKVQTTNTFGWAQIGGPISDGVITTSTATVGHLVGWVNAALISTGIANTTLSQKGAFGVFTAAGTAATTHDMMLFPELIISQT